MAAARWSDMHEESASPLRMVHAGLDRVDTGRYHKHSPIFATVRVYRAEESKPPLENLDLCVQEVQGIPVVDPRTGSLGMR